MQQRLFPELLSGRSSISFSVRLLLVTVILLSSSFLSFSIAESTPRWLQEFEDKCNAGSMKDCMNAAHSHGRGKFELNLTTPNKEKETKYLQRVIQMGLEGCENDSKLENCYQLGLMYFEGRVVNRDIPRGMKIITQACTGSYEEACMWLKNAGVMPRR